MQKNAPRFCALVFSSFLATAGCRGEQDLTSDCTGAGNVCPACTSDSDCIIVSNECHASASCTHLRRYPKLVVNSIGCGWEYDRPRSRTLRMYREPMSRSLGRARFAHPYQESCSTSRATHLVFEHARVEPSGISAPCTLALTMGSAPNRSSAVFPVVLA
jgi:hypothetical protein